MEDRFRGYANNMPNYEFWYCPRCKTERSKYVVPPPKSKPTILFPSRPPEASKSIPPDESKYFDPKKARKKA